MVNSKSTFLALANSDYCHGSMLSWFILPHLRHAFNGMRGELHTGMGARYMLRKHPTWIIHSAMLADYEAAMAACGKRRPKRSPLWKRLGNWITALVGLH